MNPQENNRLIAEFMGLTIEDGQERIYMNGLGTKPIEKTYNTSWNWLMEVVEKIESKGFDVHINTCVCRISDVGEDRFEDIETFNSASKIQAVYSAVVEFIKWYNEQNK